MSKLKNKVIYQIYPKSFLDTTGTGLGDLEGILQKLHYLQELGVDYLWLSPICTSPQRDNGYDIADYYNIDPMYGSMMDYENLIAEGKKRNIQIMMDLVLNHTSDQHEWFQKAISGEEKYRNFYVLRDTPNEIQSFFGGSAWSYHEGLGKYYLHLFDKTQPDLNWENPELREEIYQMVNFWIEKGVGGFRLDVIDLIGKEPDKLILGKGPKFYEYLEELNQRTFGDKLLTVGECWCSTLEECAKMCHPKGLTQAFHFNHLTLVDRGWKWTKKPLNLEELAQCLSKWQTEYKGTEALVMNNHDLPRLLSTWLDDTSYRKESAKLLISLFSLLKGNLYLFQGEEIGATNAHMTEIDQYNDVETKNVYQKLKKDGYPEKVIMSLIAETSRDNARVPMAWNGAKNAGFTSGTPWLALNQNCSVVNVEADLASDDSVYAYYQKMIRFRKEQEALLQEEISFHVEGDIFSFSKGNLRFQGNFSKYVVPKEKTGKMIFTNYAQEQDGLLRPYEVYVSMV
ncbi:MAG: alpha-amylase family glycosyl hydrolase [Eubacteriales bacterium]